MQSAAPSTGKKRWPKKKPDVNRRYAPRKKSKYDDDLPGEYVTWKHLEILAWIVWQGWDGSTVPAIAKATGLDPSSVRKMLTLLKRRHYLECLKPAKRVVRLDGLTLHNADHWNLTAIGRKHLVNECRARMYTPRVDQFVKAKRWKYLWRDLKTMRTEILPALLKFRGSDKKGFYRIDWLVRTRPMPYLLNMIEMAQHAANPVAYVVKSCTGSMRAANIRRCVAMIRRRRLFNDHPELMGYAMHWFCAGMPAKRWIDPFDAFQRCYDHMEAACKKFGFSEDSIDKGIAYTLGLRTAPRRTHNERMVGIA
jgi:hypothetical protein